MKLRQQSMSSIQVHKGPELRHPMRWQEIDVGPEDEELQRHHHDLTNQIRNGSAQPVTDQARG